METMDLVREVSKILRNQHPNYDHRGDRIMNASAYLREFSKKFPLQAKSIACDIECRTLELSEQTELPERRLFQISRVLLGIWCEL